MRFLAILAVLIVAAGCTSSGRGGSATATATTAATPTSRYLAALHDLHGTVAGETTDELHSLSDSELTQFGRTACDYLRHPGQHPYGPGNDFVRNGYVEEAITALAIAKAAKTFLCPDAPGSLTGS